MANDSASGGFLTPVGTEPLQGDPFEDQLQAVLVGITGLPGPMVRPRWQPNPPAQPGAEEAWAAFGITVTRSDTNAVVTHDPTGDGSDRVSRDEIVEVLVSFYGPDSAGLAATLRDGLSVAQNREALYRANMGLVRVGPVIPAPTLVNEQWIRKHDVAVTVRRRVTRTYRVLNLLSAEGAIASEGPSQNWSTES